MCMDTDLAALSKAKLALECIPGCQAKKHWLLPVMVDVTGLSLALCSLDLPRTGLRNTNIYMLSVRNSQ